MVSLGVVVGRKVASISEGAMKYRVRVRFQSKWRPGRTMVPWGWDLMCLYERTTDWNIRRRGRR